jgi:transposase InsO family protein
MGWESHVRFGGRTGETDPVKPVRALRSDPYTYIPTREGWLFLATVIDLYSRRVIGWGVADHLRTPLVVGALEMAVATRGGHVDGVVFHFDRGSTPRASTGCCASGSG